MVANVAHRGASGNYPENTLIAFQKALEIGVDEIELDLYLTKDDRLIIMHDSTVDRTTDGTGAISELTLAEIKVLDAGRAFGEQFRGERVPTWEEALELVQGKVGLNVHLKEGGNPDGHYERKVAKALNDFHMVEDSILTCSDASVGIFAEIDSRIECRIFRANRYAGGIYPKIGRDGASDDAAGAGHHDSGFCSKSTCGRTNCARLLRGYP